MKLALNKIKQIPKNLGFGFCVYGKPSEEISEWSKLNNLVLQDSGPYTNVILNEDTELEDIFETPRIFEYGDFFSPNLNKHLHLGHLSNLIIAKSLQSLGIAKNTIAILGDTMEGSVNKEDAYNKYNEYCNQFGYHIDKIYFASEQVLKNTNILVDGSGEFEGTKVFEIYEQKIVGIKSFQHNYATTYFYQDVALAEMLNAPTLYLTGTEQIPHFESLKKLYANVNHIGLGLVLTDGKKQSSSAGNVLFMEELLELVKGKFNNDSELAWNILAGFILKYDLPSIKDIKLKDIDNVKLSHGLYLSYTLARLKSAGMVSNKIDNFNSKSLQFKLLRAKIMISPNILFEELIEHCRTINKLYIDHHIKDNVENQQLFQPMLDDLVFGMLKIGMFDIEKV
jgi:arginyl-tRNA synthetase